MKPIYFDFLCGSLDFVFSIIKGQIYIDLPYRNKLSTKDLPICNENKVFKVIIEFHGFVVAARIMYFSYRCTVRPCVGRKLVEWPLPIEENFFRNLKKNVYLSDF